MTNSSAASTVPAATGPLAGLRVLDISTVIAGPFAATMLADLGADVLKVEMPGAGDALRRLAPHKDGVPLWWKVTNRNKKGITLDITAPDGREKSGRVKLLLVVRGRISRPPSFRPSSHRSAGFDAPALT